MYPLDRRKQSHFLYKIFKSLRKTAFLLQVSHTTISRWLKEEISSKKIYDTSNRLRNSKSYKIVDTIKLIIQNNPFISLHQLKYKIQELFNFSVSKELLRTIIRKNKYSKKRARFYGSPKNLPEKTKVFLEKRSDYIAKGFPFDETSFGRNGRLTKGYSPVGKFLTIMKSFPRITTQSALVAISQNYLLKVNHVIGSFNKERFLSFLKSLELDANTVILLDNVSFHRSKEVVHFANSKGRILLYTPPYSPWFNPIEGVFSICKRYYYQNWDIEGSFNAINQSHISSFFKKSLNINSMPTK